MQVFTLKTTMIITVPKMHAGLTWQDDDFVSNGLDPNCLPLDFSTEDEVARRRTRVFHACIKDWVKKGIGPQGSSFKKYCILCK